MNLGDLVPWNRKDRPLDLQDGQSRRSGTPMNPFLRLHQEMNRLFDEVWRGGDLPWAREWPSLEVRETDDGYRVTAELPGMDEKDIEVSFSDHMLTIRGERQSESDAKDRTVSERYYGRFERRIGLDDADESRAKARFEKGVLTIDLPRSKRAREKIRRIPINEKSATTK
jgi:HSP20 family protein